eukprot:Em0004g5a
MAAFSELAVMPEIVKAVEELDWLLPTDVQAEAVPLILGGGDVLMAAETGSGKTGVYETLRDRQQGKSVKAMTSSKPKEVILNAYDKDDAFAIAPDGLLCQCREHKEWNGCRSTMGVTTGKYYYEATVTDEGLCRLGWSTRNGVRELGKDKFGFGYGGTAKKSTASQFDDYGETFGRDDTIGCYLDLDGFSVAFSKNGKQLGKAFDIPPFLHGESFYAAVVLKNAEMHFNFGSSAFKYPPTGDFVALSKSDNLVPFQAQPSVGREKMASVRRPSAIIIEPSRELAQQTHDNITQFKKYIPPPHIRELLVIGGDSAKIQLKSLQEGVDIVIGTPGRLDDLITTGKLDLSGVSFFVLDEADGLLSQGHQDFISKVYNQLPKVSLEGRRIQMIVCSATLHNPQISKLAEKLMHFPTWVDLKGLDAVPDTVHHVVCYVDPLTDVSWQNPGKKQVQTDGIHRNDNVSVGNRNPETLSEAVKVLKAEYLVKAIKALNMDQAIIFCRTKIDCDNIEGFLLSLGGRGGGGPKAMVNEYSCVCLHADRRPEERKENLKAFKEGEARFLICTDVAARGIDICGIPFVVNLTLPDEQQSYVHRIGRVGRADRMGLAISLVSKVKEKVWYHTCPSRGKKCNNTQLVDDGGCAMWYDELQYLQDIEAHLGVTIPEVGDTFAIPVNEYDGKVMYGEKRSASTGGFQGHVDQLAPAVQQLAAMEHLAQTTFLKMHAGNKWFI